MISHLIFDSGPNGVDAGPFTELDILYLIERRDAFATLFSDAIFRNPLLVLIGFATFLLPIAAVFTPASLGVVTASYTGVSAPCMVPSGNLSSCQTGSALWNGAFSDISGATTLLTQLASQTFVRQQIPPLPQACGPNCTYHVSMNSIAFECQPLAAVPEAMMVQGGVIEPSNDGYVTIWNSTLDRNADAPYEAVNATSSFIIA